MCPPLSEVMFRSWAGRLHTSNKRLRPPVGTFVQPSHTTGHNVKFCQASLKDTGLAVQHGHLILGTSHQLCPLRRGTRSALVGHVLCMGLLPSACAPAHMCYCWHILPGCRRMQNCGPAPCVARLPRKRV